MRDICKLHIHNLYILRTCCPRIEKGKITESFTLISSQKLIPVRLLQFCIVMFWVHWYWELILHAYNLQNGDRNQICRFLNTSCSAGTGDNTVYQYRFYSDWMHWSHFRQSTVNISETVSASIIKDQCDWGCSCLLYIYILLVCGAQVSLEWSDKRAVGWVRPSSILP